MENITDELWHYGSMMGEDGVTGERTNSYGYKYFSDKDCPADGAQLRWSGSDDLWSASVRRRRWFRVQAQLQVEVPLSSL